MIDISKELIDKIYKNIKIYHPNITDEYLHKLDDIDVILAWCHPDDRIVFKREIENIKVEEKI